MAAQMKFFILLVVGFVAAGAFAEPEADPQNIAGSEATFYYPYKSYGSANGYPYRPAYHSPHTYNPSYRPPLAFRNVVPRFVQALDGSPVPIPERAQSNIFQSAISLSAPLASRFHLKAVPAVPEDHFEIATPVIPTAPVAPALPFAPSAHALTIAPATPRIAPPVSTVPSPALTPIHPVINHAISTQYHSQDELGNVAYGYSNPNSAKQETRDAYGNVQGAYSYVDATGLPKHVSYVADDNGFRVTSSNT